MQILFVEDRRQAFTRKSPILISDLLEYFDFISEETEDQHWWGDPHIALSRLNTKLTPKKSENLVPLSDIQRIISKHDRVRQVQTDSRYRGSVLLLCLYPSVVV